MLISKAIDYFITALSTEQLSNHSLRAYHQDLNQFCSLVQKSELDHLNFDDFHHYFTKVNHLKVASVKRKRVVLHRFLKFCYKKRMCKSKLYELIDPIKSKKTHTPKDVLTKDEITKVMAYLLNQKNECFRRAEQNNYDYFYYCAVRNSLLINILLYTGCRANEAVSIRKQDINLLNNTITLLTKGDKYNQVPIHAELLKALNDYNEAILLIKDPSLHIMLESSFLFPSKHDVNAHLSSRTLHDLMNKLSIVLGRHIHAHLFRHTFASYCIAANMDISTISSLISHSNPSITLSIYTHEIDAHNKQEQIKKLNFT